MERSEEHTSELQSHVNLVCRLLLEKKKDRRGSRNRSSPSSATPIWQTTPTHSPYTTLFRSSGDGVKAELREAGEGRRQQRRESTDRGQDSQADGGPHQVAKVGGSLDEQVDGEIGRAHV